MTTTSCPRNLPQHFNGCTCAANGTITAEAAINSLTSPGWPDRLVSSHEFGLEGDPSLEFSTDEGAEVVIVPPDDGDGETYYWEARLNGHVWDGRGDTLDEAQAQARSEATRMSALEPLDDEDDEDGWM